ncbi:MAG: hypothetical protein H6756_03285 [Candidatus Omnitrophica bacterium]|nr:hypothetical protein [Candidatus Omnitrophota bacterium]
MMIRVLVLLLAVSLAACDSAQSPKMPTVVSNKAQAETPPQPVQPAKPVVEEESQESDFRRFYVYSDKGARDNHYVPSGFMPDGKCISFNDRWQEECQNGKTCIKIVYDIECSKEHQEWAGIYWLNPANNWGRRKGGYNLTGATKLTFWAKGEIGGEQIQEFTIGGVEGDYPDSDKIVIGPVILSDEWKQYSVDLQGKDLSYISGGFAWSTEVAVNPESCVFYLDEIKFQ